MLLLYVGLALLAAYLVALVLATRFFFRIAFIRDGAKKTPAPVFSRITGDGDKEPAKDEGREWLLSQKMDTLTLKSADGLTLYASLLSPHKGKKLAIILHGWTGNRTEVGGLTRLYTKLGFDCLLPDLRASGDSEGKYYSFGFKDKDDVALWAQLGVQMGYESILVAGHSMGGATVMMAAGVPMPAQVKAFVEDCGYTSVYDQFSLVLDRMLSKPLLLFFKRPILLLASGLNRAKQGFGLKEASSIHQLQKAVLPVLFIHGDQDGFVPSWMAEKCFAACASKKERLIVRGADHCGSIRVDPALYEQAVRAFALKYTDIVC